METDWAIGQIVDAVDKAGLAKNTLVIVTADNGCSSAAVSRGGKSSLNLTFRQGKKAANEPGKHYASGVYRGHKADIYEGGHRVPFIARWNGRVRAGSTCEATVCLVDLFATCAELTGSSLAQNEAVDSMSFLGHLSGREDFRGRETVVHHSINGSFSLRSGKWKLIFCPGSGGWSAPRPIRPKAAKKPAAERRDRIEWAQLFDLSADPAEERNVAKDHPEVVERLTKVIRGQIDRGRSTEGEPQKNGGETHLYPKWIRGLRSARSNRTRS